MHFPRRLWGVLLGTSECGGSGLLGRLDLYQQCLIIDDNTEAAALVWETKLMEVTSDVDIMRSKIQVAIAVMDAAARPVATRPAPSAPTNQIRVVDRLKPPVLSLQNTPVEFRNLKRKLDTFLVQAASTKRA